MTLNGWSFESVTKCHMIKVRFIFAVAGLEHDTHDVARGPVGGGRDGMLPEGLRRISEERLDHLCRLVVSQHQSAEN